MKKAIIPLTTIIIIAIGAFIYLNRLIPFRTLEIDGYIFDNNNITQNLINGLTPESEALEYEEINVNDVIYSSGRNYFLSQRRKSVSLDLPIISKDASSLVILSEIGNYIDEDFIKTEAYVDTTIVDAHLYNGINNEQVDNIEYLFLEMNNGLYANLKGMTIKSNSEEYEIKENSIISFQKNIIRYYYLQDGKFIFKEIPILNTEYEISLGNFTGTYEDLLILLEIIKDNKENPKKIDIIKEIDQTPEPKKDDKKKEEQKPSSDGYVKPEVTLTSVNADIYSFKGNISVYDPSSAIVKQPTFEFKIADQIYMRKTIYEAGDYNISGLLPNTEYQVIATYIYKNEQGQLVQRTIYDDIIKTKPTDSLSTIDISKEKISSSVDSIKIEGLSLKNLPNDEVLNGVKKIIIKIGNNTYSIPNREAKDLIALQKITYETPNTLNSNTEYNVSILFFDVANNEMATSNNEFTIKTKKAAPSGNIKITTTEYFKEARLEISIDNKDDLEVEEYKYKVFEINKDNAGGTTATNITSEIIGTNVDKTITNLKTNKRYVVKIYCDYYDEDGNFYDDYEIANKEFITYDINNSNIQYKITVNTDNDGNPLITSRSAKITISYANIEEDSNPIFRLLSDTVDVDIININTKEVEQTITGVRKALFFSGAELEFTNLNSNTNYRIEARPIVSVNDDIINIKTSYYAKNNEIKTLKQEAIYDFSNVYIAAGYIDFDLSVYDKDGAIQENNAVLNVYDKDEKKIYTKDIKITKGNLTENNELIKNRITLDKMFPENSVSAKDGGTYTFKIVADNYNNGRIQESKKIIGQTRKYTLSGTNGKINVEKVLDKIYYDAAQNDLDIINKNLFDISNFSRWKSAGQNNNFDLKNTDVEKNIVTLSAKNGYRIYNYYIPELIGKKIAISFQLRKTKGDQKICITNGASGCGTTINYQSDEYSDRLVYTFNSLNTTGYISFYVYEIVNQNNITTYELKDLKIEQIGADGASDFTPYEDADKLKGGFTININEANEYSKNKNSDYRDINSDEYEFRFRTICKGQKCREESNTIEPLDISSGSVYQNSKVFLLEEDSEYSAVISVYNLNTERYYDLVSFELATDREMRTISSVDELVSIHPKGYYIVTEDLDFRNTNKSVGTTFNGVLDFQGHKIIKGSKQGAIFSTIGDAGVIKNIDLHHDFSNNTDAVSGVSGLFSTNYGLISNIKVTLDYIPDKPNNRIYLMGTYNRGTIENFVFHGASPFYGAYFLTYGPCHNYGIMKNGYAYGEPIIADHKNESTSDLKNVGIFAYNLSSNSSLSNFYSTIEIKTNTLGTTKEDYVGSVSAVISDKANVYNGYVYSPSGNMNRNTNYDVMAASITNANVNKLYYISNINYNDKISKQILESFLKNADFQADILNEDKIFNIMDAWRNNYFPHLLWPDSMPIQDYIDLPDTGSNQGIKVMSVDRVKYLNPNDNNGYEAAITLSLYNKKNVKILGFDIENIPSENIKIVSQAAPNNDGVSQMELQIKQPNYYLSQYLLKNIRTYQGSISVYESIDLNLYLSVKSTTDITDGIYEGNENFRLDKDIDCSKETCNSIGTIKGKIDGNNHTITNYNFSGCFITKLTNKGELKNINFENISFKPAKFSNEYRGGLICGIDRATVDNVFVNNASVYLNDGSTNGATNYIGVIAAYSNYGTIKNSAIVDLKVNISDLGNTKLAFGSFIGQSDVSTISNDFARKIDINIGDSISIGYGGLVGIFNNGTIKETYATGNILAASNYVGGIVGYNTGFISKTISKVNVTSSQSFIGGIAGYSAIDKITKTISIGNILTTSSEPDAKFARTSPGDGKERLVISDNFAAYDQKVNNTSTKNTNGESLLTIADLSNSIIYGSKVGLGNYFDLSECNFISGYLPMLKDTSDKLMKNQLPLNECASTSNNIQIPEEYDDLKIYNESKFKFISSSFEYNEYFNNDTSDSKLATKANLKINLEYTGGEITDINMVNIPGLIIERVNAEITGNTIELTIPNVRPQNYYDSYILTDITYYDGQTDKNETTSMKIDLKFYGQLNTAADWQNITIGTKENYVLTNNIYFDNLTTPPKSEISFNRLESATNWQGDETNNQETPTYCELVEDSPYQNPPLCYKIGYNNPDNIKELKTSLINNIYSDIRNIIFTNIKISTTSSLSGVGIFKELRANSVEILNFDNINIYAPNSSFIGIIGDNRALDIRDILLDNISLSGNTYVGGLIGRSLAYDKTRVTLNNINITAKNSYTGGMLGYEYYDSKSVHNYNIKGADIEINKTNYNYTGGLFGYGWGNKISIADSEINVNGSSGSYVGCIFGYGGGEYLLSTNCQITTAGSYAGGIAGQSQRGITYAYVIEPNIQGKNGVGGIAGYSYNGISYSGVQGGIITGNSNVGGIKGSGPSNINYNYVKDTEVEGATNVGGLLGQAVSSSVNVYLNESNAKVTATISSAGGAVGHLNNLKTTTYDNKRAIYNNVIANSIISASNYSGGLIGQIDAPLLDNKYYYNNYITADVSCSSEEECKAGYIIGGNSDEHADLGDFYAENMNNTYLYKNNTLSRSLNEEPIKIVDNTYYKELLQNFSNPVTFLERDQLQNYYPSSTIFAQVNGKFPKIVYSPLSVKDYEVEFDLPAEDHKPNTRRRRLFAGLPEIDRIYAVAADKINIEFKTTNENAYLKVNNESYIINEKVFTFYYDFIEDFEIEITDGVNTNVISVSAEDLKNTMSIIDDNYYYIDDGEIITDQDLDLNEISIANWKGEYKLLNNTNNNYSYALLGEIKLTNNAINIYENEILLDNKNIYDITTQETKLNYFENLTRVSTEPIYTYNYNNQVIKTYNSYSTINDIAITSRIIMTTNQLELIRANVNASTTNILADNYNGKSYLVYLDKNNKLYSAKDTLNYPKEFENYNIKNIYAKNKIMLVEYYDGNYLIFNYVSGELLEQKSSNKPNLKNYIKKYFAKTFNSNNLQKPNSNYLEAKEMISKLKEKSISEVLNANGDPKNYKESSNYTIVYNPYEQSYVVYEVPNNNSLSTNTNLLNSLNNTSVTEQINNNDLLYKYYKEGQKSKFISLPALIIVISIISLIILGVILLGKNLRKKINS